MMHYGIFSTSRGILGLGDFCIGVHWCCTWLMGVETKIAGIDSSWEHWESEMVCSLQFCLTSMPNSQCNSPRSVISTWSHICAFKSDINSHIDAAIMQSSTWTLIVNFLSAEDLKKTTLHCVNLSECTKILMNFWYQWQPLCFRPYSTAGCGEYKMYTYVLAML